MSAYVSVNCFWRGANCFSQNVQVYKLHVPDSLDFMSVGMAFNILQSNSRFINIVTY